MLLFIKPPSFGSKPASLMPDDPADDELRKRSLIGHSERSQSKRKQEFQRQKQRIKTLCNIRKRHSLEWRFFYKKRQLHQNLEN